MTTKKEAKSIKKQTKKETSDAISKSNWAAKLYGHAKHGYLFEETPSKQSKVSNN